MDITLSILVLGLFAIPLWYVWRVNDGTLTTYVQAEDVQHMVRAIRAAVEGGHP